jgi:glycosyltransferase involved in cell wall biosynthesis
MSSNANVSVVLPTYRRSGPLRWSLASVLKQRLPENLAGLRLVVLNNDTETASVDQAVDEIKCLLTPARWDIRIVHRNPPLYPVYNWYEGIRQFTEPGDVVFLHGDDDLMLPGNLETRLRMMQSTQCHFLLTGSAGGMFYHEYDGQLRGLIPTEPLEVDAHSARPMTVEELAYSAFISNHGYRNTPEFWDAYDVTLKRMNSIPVETVDKLAMLPLFLPIPLIDRGLASAQMAITCMRGMSTADLLEAGFGRQAWTRPGFYYVSCLYVLSRTDLKDRPELDPLRKRYRHLTLRYLLASRTMSDFRETARGLGLGKSAVSPAGLPDVLRGFGDMIKALLGINALRLRRRLRRDHGVTFEELFSRYWSEN